MPYRQAEGLIADARTWRGAVSGRAASYHRVLEELEALVGQSPEVASRVEAAWRDRSFSIFYERPLLLLAALRFDALGRGEAHPLWAALRDHAPDASGVTAAAVRAALEPDAVWEAMRDCFVQTNETSRALAWVWPASLAGCDLGGRPLAIVELGCAAGLNLAADEMTAPWTDAGGAALPVLRSPCITLRLGIDRRPLSLDPDTERFLRACIWAGETRRLQRFDAAVAAFRRLDPPAVIEVGDLAEAGGRLARVGAEVAAGGLVLAFQTIVRDYLDPAADDAYERAMRSWLASCPPGRALWTELELDPGGDPHAHPAALRAHVADPRGEVVDLVLARTGYHPSDVAVHDPAVARLRALTGG